MPIKPFTQDDFRTTNHVKNGFMHGIFKDPKLIENHLAKMFGDATLTFHNEPQSKTFVIECISSEWCANKYHRAFRFTYKERPESNDNIIINVEEL